MVVLINSLRATKIPEGIGLRGVLAQAWVAFQEGRPLRSTFSHPDYTVGSGLSPDLPTTKRARRGSRARQI